MIISRIRLNPSLRDTQRALVNPNVFHGAVSCATSREEDRPLWRVDSLRGERYLLIVSEKKPELDRLVTQFGYSGDSGEFKSYDPFLEHIRSGSIWQFRLVCNPTESKAPSKLGGRGQRKQINIPELQIEWLKKAAQKNGFSIDPESVDVNKNQKISFVKGHGSDKRNVSFQSSVLQGHLVVTDAELFRAALKKGIGREKAYGQGLLTIVRPALKSP